MGFLRSLFGGGEAAASAEDLLAGADADDDARRAYADLRRQAPRFAAELGAGAPLHSRLTRVCRQLLEDQGRSVPDGPAPSTDVVTIDGDAVGTFGALVDAGKARSTELLCLVFGRQHHGGDPVGEAEAALALARDDGLALVFVGEEEAVVRRSFLLRCEGMVDPRSEDIAADLQDCARKLGLRETGG